MDVGIRELKAHLSAYLDRVQGGEEVIVTERGKPIARIEPLPKVEVPEAMRHLVESGRMVDKGPMRHFPRRIRMTPGDKTSTDFVREQRR
jgi:prevent-host-death family protein